jgi:hypothetical protein
MELHTELKLRFDEPIWAYSPELALFDIFIEKHPEMVTEVGKDVLKLVKNNGKGRQDSPSVETVLRAAIYMSIEKLTYRDLEKHMYDSKYVFIFFDWKMIIIIALVQCRSLSLLSKRIQSCI